MKTKIFLTLAVMLLISSCSYSQQKSAGPLKGQSPKGGVNVVELFTSEGCSSCPAADALMPKLKEEYGDALIVLAFHVDYWDRLGWKDAFSNPEWTHRQNQYAAALHNDNVYTPQAVVNGRRDITGSNSSGLHQLIDKGPGALQPGRITLSATRASGNMLSVAYDATLKRGETVHIALVQHHAVTNVRRGENGGRQLQHYNVVRDFKSTGDSKGSVLFSLPAGLTAGDVGVVAFVQDNENMHISSAKEIGVE